VALNKSKVSAVSPRKNLRGELNDSVVLTRDLP
jgi:hypothetical protein